MAVVLKTDTAVQYLTTLCGIYPVEMYHGSGAAAYAMKQSPQPHSPQHHSTQPLHNATDSPKEAHLSIGTPNCNVNKTPKYVAFWIRFDQSCTETALHTQVNLRYRYKDETLKEKICEPWRSSTASVPGTVDLLERPLKVTVDGDLVSCE